MESKDKNTGATFQRERAHDLIDEIKPLLQSHWQEISHFADIPLDPDYEKYIQMEELGILRCFTIRDAGQLIGYVVYFVVYNPHYQTSLQANQDILFLEQSRRGMLLGMRLLKFASNELASEGVQVEYQHIKASHNFGPMLEHIGFELADLIFVKRLDKK